MILQAVLIDDEKNNLEHLRMLLEQYCPNVTVVACATDAEEGKQIILKHDPDLVFLDITMPDKNGFDLLRSLPRYDFEVIFVTAYDQFGIQAVKFAAIDYLLKPVEPDELQKAVNRVFEKKQRSMDNLSLQNLVQVIKNQHSRGEHKIALPALKETRFVYPADIVRCESSNNYTTFMLRDGGKILVSRPIYEYEEILRDYGFVRCHQSHLVNKSAVKSWVKIDGEYLLLENGDEVPISRGKKEEVAARLKTNRDI